MNELEIGKKTFKIREYQGDRIRVPVSGCLNIRKIYHWNKLLKKYVEPPRGSKYEARRSRGKNKEREVKNFDFLQEAKDWQVGRNFSSLENNQNLILSKNSDEYLIENLLNDWQRIVWPNIRESTRNCYDSRITYFRPILNVPVEKLTPKIIDEWILLLKHPDMLLGYKSTRTSFEKELKVLGAMIRWYIENNDDAKLTFPIKKRHKANSMIREKKVIEIKYLTFDEYLCFLEKLKQYSSMFWALAVTQQSQVLRISEAAAMKWSNLDLNNRTYKVTDHVLWARVRGNKTYISPGTKTNRSGETFNSPLRQVTMTALKELEELKHGELIFHDQGNILSYRQIQHAYDTAFKKAGLSHRSTHVLRHTGATLFLEETGDPLALQQIGNWKDQKMALHYGKILSSRARNAIDKAENRSHLKLIQGEKSSEAI